MNDFAENQLNMQFCANFSAVRRHETIGTYTRVLLRLDRHKISRNSYIMGYIDVIIIIYHYSLLLLFMFMVINRLYSDLNFDINKRKA